MPELTKSDLVITPDGRTGIIISSRGEDRTIVGFANGTSEQIPRSHLRLALKSWSIDREELEAAHATRLPVRRASGRVALPSS